MPIGNDWYQRTSARAKANPGAFNRAINAGVPRLFFFFFVPIFALLLELFYRREGYYLDHLIFALYDHAFVFLSLAALLFVRLTLSWAPGPLTIVVNSVVIAWLMAYLPLSLKRAYGGTWPTTFLKLVTFIAFVTF